MQRGPNLHFKCVSCTHPLEFSVLNVKSPSHVMTCTQCQKNYLFGPDIFRQLQKFEALCIQIHESEEILGYTSVAIDVGPHHVKVPYRLLLTRLGSVMNLMIGENKVEIHFRTEPLQDI